MIRLSKCGTALYAAASLFLLAGCGSSGYLATSAAPAVGAAAEHAEPEHRAADEVERRLRYETQAWRGTPYRYGGITRQGVDCSGFAQAVYRDAFGLALPRTTEEQVQEGTHAPRGALQPGDLVFFRPRGKTRHVGIYLSRGEFAHAATSEGVTVSRLDEAYWRDAFWTARRLLPDAPAPAADLARPPPAPAAHRAAVRTSW